MRSAYPDSAMRPDCDHCHEMIADFNDAGRLGKRWLHKSCWLQLWRAERERGVDLPVLTSPLGTSPGESRVLLFALMFHFGLGLALIGWVLLTQEDSPVTGAICLAIGLIAPLIGVVGIAYSVYRRRQYEGVLAEIGGASGWTALPTPEPSRD
jgi:hypothetical protein